MNFDGHIDAAASLMRAERLLTESDLGLAASDNAVKPISQPAYRYAIMGA